LQIENNSLSFEMLYYPQKLTIHALMVDFEDC